MKKQLICLILFLITGCAQLPRPSSQIAIYDFGMTSSPEPKHLNLRYASTTAAAGLDTTDIRYRLGYKDAARVYRYTESRWLAPPAELFNQSLLQRAIFDNTGDAACTLRLELMTFDQVFDSPQASRGIVRLRAILTQPDRRTPPIQQELVLEKPSDTPNAHGGVTALTAAADEAITQLIAWSEKMDCRP